MKTCNKTICYLFLFFNIMSFGISQTTNIQVAPLVIYTDTDTVISDYDDSNELITKNLQERWFEGLVLFNRLSKKQAGNIQSTFDAINICEAEKCDYLLYGYIKQTEYSIFAEVKLFNRNSKHIEKIFYSSDSKDEYIRLIATLSSNIAEYIGNLLNIDLDKKDEKIVFSTLSFPFSIGYWTHLNEVWNTHLLGIIRVSSGIYWKPPFLLPMFLGKKLSLYIEPEISFKYALGNTDYYPANYFSIECDVPVYLTMLINNVHSISFGLGFLYEFNILNIISKYEDESTHIANDFGLLLSLVYDYSLNNKWDLTCDITSGLPFSQNSGFWASLNLGARIKITEREVTK